MVPENPLEVSPIIGQKDTMFRDFEKESDLVKNPKNVLIGCPLHAEEQSLVVHRCICQGLGCTFGRPDSGMWSDTEANLHVNILELKAVFLGIRSFQPI